VEGKSYSQRSCCNSDSPFPSETTCSAPPSELSLPPTSARPSELSLPPTIARPSELSPAPTPAPPPWEWLGLGLGELIGVISGIILGVVGAAAAVLALYYAAVAHNYMRQSNPSSSLNSAVTPSNVAASSVASIDVDFLQFLASTSVNNGEGGLVNTSENDNNGTRASV
jgi:hypothetical protein